ncbi:MAG: hypothetical protein H0X02_12145 [Nitrosomonas sp.]|nr:hypothetical protein [Nitrosomonas sp.]
MNTHNTVTVSSDPGTLPNVNYYENRLREWVKKSGLFSIEEAIEFLGLDPEILDALPSIRNALENLGCERKVIVIYHPPAANAESIHPEPIYNVTVQPTNPGLQSIINIIRDWVFSQKESFTINDIYNSPRISENLACTRENMLLIDQALAKLRCTTEQNCNNAPMWLLRYTPPKILRVSRDEIHT